MNLLSKIGKLTLKENSKRRSQLIKLAVIWSKLMRIRTKRIQKMRKVVKNLMRRMSVLLMRMKRHDFRNVGRSKKTKRSVKQRSWIKEALTMSA